MSQSMYLNTPERVAEAVRSSRRARGWSQTYLAEQSGVGRRFIHDLESGHPRAEIGKVLDVLDALEIHAMALPSVPSDLKRGQLDLKKAAGRA